MEHDYARINDGAPNCYLVSHSGKLFRHNFFPHQYFKCDSFFRALISCPAPQLFQQSLSKCVWPHEWIFEPLITIETSTTEVPLRTETPITSSPKTTPSTTTNPGIAICDKPQCDSNWSNILQPSNDPTKFYQCTPYGVELMPCAPGTYFGYNEQTCVWPNDWINHCELTVPDDCLFDNPRCDIKWINVLQPAADPSKFYQCTPYGVELMLCAPGTYFDYKTQICIFERDWVNPCQS